MEDEEYYYRAESDLEPDSDHEDQDSEHDLGQWLGQLETLKMVSKSKMRLDNECKDNLILSVM